MESPSVFKKPSNPLSILRFASAASKSEKLSILLVGQSEFCHLMSECIYTVSKQGEKLELTISKSESIENVLKSSSSFHVDFIVFLMNTGQRHCIEQVERNICLVDPVYLCDKMILVNGSNNLGLQDLGLSYDELFNLSQKYRLHIFHGDIKNEKSRIYLATSILNFVEDICGQKTGIPMVLDFPSNKFPLY